MASGLTVSGRGDLDGLFGARSSAKRADVGIRVGGTDISNRYETIGGASPITAVGYRSAGTDLASLFRGASAFSLTAGLELLGSDARTGLYPSGIGSLSPTTFAGATVQGIVDNTNSVPPNTFQVQIAGSRAANFFTSITINGVTFLTSAATYVAGSPTNWIWSGTLSGMVPGNVYPVSIL